MNVGRPKGYAEPPPTMAANAAKLNMAQMFAAQLSGAPAPVMTPTPVLPQLPMQALSAPGMLPPPPQMATNVVLLENLMPVGQVRGETEKAEVRKGVVVGDLFCVRFGYNDPVHMFVSYMSAQRSSDASVPLKGRGQGWISGFTGDASRVQEHSGNGIHLLSHICLLCFCSLFFALDMVSSDNTYLRLVTFSVVNPGTCMAMLHCLAFACLMLRLCKLERCEVFIVGTSS